MTASSFLPIFRGTLRYEARMVIRQRALWYAVVPLSLLALVVAWRLPSEIADGVRHVGEATLVTGIQIGRASCRERV